MDETLGPRHRMLELEYPEKSPGHPGRDQPAILAAGQLPGERGHPGLNPDGGRGDPPRGEGRGADWVGGEIQSLVACGLLGLT